MNLLHTLEEIKYFENLNDQNIKLRNLGTKYNNQELIDLADKYNNIVISELEKYNGYIGKECSAPPLFLSENKHYRQGKIEGKFYFNSYSKSVRCNFRYKSGGFDTHAIKELR